MFKQFTIHECNSNNNNNSFEFLETKTNRRSTTATTPLYSDDSDMNTTDKSIANHKRSNFNRSISPTKDKLNSNNNNNNGNSSSNNNYMMITTSQPICRKLNFYEDDTMDMNGVNHSSSTNTCNNNISKASSLDSFDSLNDNNTPNNTKQSNLLFIRKKSSTNFSFYKHKFDEDYVIIKTLSLGEQGTVYLCVKTKDNKVYVVKVTQEFTSKTDYITMYDFEQCLRNNYNTIFSRFILDYKDFWIENENDSEHALTSYTYTHNNKRTNTKQLYIVTEHCSNGNLLSYMERLIKFHYDFPSSFYYDIIFEMLCAVLFIHKLGYIHFDIKPTNFLVDIDGNIKLTDFCLSRTQSFVNANTPDVITEGDSVYLSPELFDKKGNVDYKTDVFSLGLTVLEVLSGVTLPKNGDVWIAIRNKGVPDWCYEGITVDKEVFTEVIKEMTSVDKAKRPSVEEVLMNKRYKGLYERYMLLLDGEFKKEFNPGKWKEFTEEMVYEFGEEENINVCFAKRSDSTKFVN